MQCSFSHLLPNHVATELIGESALWCLDAVVVVDAEDQTLQEEFPFCLFGLFADVPTSDPFVLCRFLFEAVDGVVFVVCHVASLFVEMLEVGVY
jgi:hypothetical protein